MNTSASHERHFRLKLHQFINIACPVQLAALFTCWYSDVKKDERRETVKKNWEEEEAAPTSCYINASDGEKTSDTRPASTNI